MTLIDNTSPQGTDMSYTLRRALHHPVAKSQKQCAAQAQHYQPTSPASNSSKCAERGKAATWNATTAKHQQTLKNTQSQNTVSINLH